MNPNTIVGLFYSDENNLVYENIKYSEKISDEVTNKLRLLSFKFLGPLFLTASSLEGSNWKIDFIESSLSNYQKRTIDVDVIQSFFNLNSSMYSGDGITNLFTLIVSPYTEDIKVIYEKMVKYIHPCIIQGKILKESMLGNDFNLKKFIEEELERGINLIEISLGSSRKMYWEEQSKYHCVSFIERKKSDKSKESHLYT